MLTKKKENNLIHWWKKYFKAQIKWLRKKNYTEEEIKTYLKDIAQEQLNKIEDMRPIKEKTAREQANNIQLEYLDYLEKVKEIGYLE